MTIRLEDLRRAHYKQLCNCSDPAYCIQTGSRFSATPTFEPVTASEVASVLSDADLLGELVRRGVLTVRTEHRHAVDGVSIPGAPRCEGAADNWWVWRLVTDWGLKGTEPVGESEPPLGHPDSYLGVSPVPWESE